MDIKEPVREKYGEAALHVKSGGSFCCGSVPSSQCCVDPIMSNLYDPSETSAIPEEAVLASLKCGNPTVLARLNPGETDLDLGSGGNIDVLLSAERVGETGKAYGLDITDEMLPAEQGQTRSNRRYEGAGNRYFHSSIEGRRRLHGTAVRLRLTVCDNARESCSIFPGKDSDDSPKLRRSRRDASSRRGSAGRFPARP